MSDFNLTKENYYSNEANNVYWSASLVKEFMDCPARAVAELHGEYERPLTTALLVGGFIDAWFEGDEAFYQFIEDHRSEIFQANGKKMRSEFIKAGDMINRARDDELFMEYMEGDKQTIMTGELFGFPFKCKFDVLHTERTVDLKTVKDFEPVYVKGQGKLSFADAWNWPLQMAIYQQIRAQNEGGEIKPCYLACITKQTPPDIEVVQVDDESMQAEMEVLAEKMPLFDAFKQGVIEPHRCEKCEYCRKTKKLKKPRLIGYYRMGDFADDEAV